MIDPLIQHARSHGAEMLDGRGDPIRFKGVCLAGWLSMENFITGYPACESMMGAAVLDVLGPEKYELFFDRLLTAFFADADAAFPADLGFNAARVPALRPVPMGSLRVGANPAALHHLHSAAGARGWRAPSRSRRQ